MTQTEKSSRRLLAEALTPQFGETEAEKLACIIHVALQSENIYTDQIPLAEEDRHDLLLMAFEERILLPVRGRMTGSWEDRALRFVADEMFFMPHLARILFQNASQTGVLDPEGAVREVLSHHPAEHVEQAVAFLREMTPHADSCMAEGGLMSAVAKKAGITTDLHDIVDACVVGGIMSPCTRGFATQGLAWYEFHPGLYWDTGLSANKD